MRGPILDTRKNHKVNRLLLAATSVSEKVVFLLPGCSFNQKVFRYSERLLDPDRYEAIAPVRQQGSPSHGFFATGLSVGAAEQTFGLSIRDLYTPVVRKSLDGLFLGSSRVRIKESRLRVFTRRISNYHD